MSLALTGQLGIKLRLDLIIKSIPQDGSSLEIACAINSYLSLQK